MWRNWIAHTTSNREVAGSNPVTDKLSDVVQWLGFLAFTEKAGVQFPASELLSVAQLVEHLTVEVLKTLNRGNQRVAGSIPAAQNFFLWSYSVVVITFGFDPNNLSSNLSKTYIFFIIEIFNLAILLNGKAYRLISILNRFDSCNGRKQC